MAPVEAKVTIHRLSSWATIFLSDKEHISEEVRISVCQCTCINNFAQKLWSINPSFALFLNVI